MTSLPPAAGVHLPPLQVHSNEQTFVDQLCILLLLYVNLSSVQMLLLERQTDSNFNLNYPAKGAGNKKQKKKLNSWKYFIKRCARKGLVTWECRLHGLMICTSTLRATGYLGLNTRLVARN